MLRRSLLRGRIVGAYLLLATILGTLFCVIGFMTIRSIEDRLINHRLEKAAETLINDHLHGTEHRLPGDPSVLHGAQVQPVLRALNVGVHEVTIDGRALHVLVHDYDGERYVILDNEEQFERIERYLFLALAGTFGLCLGLAAMLGLSTASRVIAPVISLSQAVQKQTLSANSAELLAPDEIGVLARALAAHSEEMQRFLLREQLFTGDVSHELRTPLTVMLGAAELLRARLSDRPDLQVIAERIRRTAADTAERVGALLLLSRSPESIDAPMIDVVPILEHEIERCRPLLHGKPVEIGLTVSQPAIRVAARPELVAIALGNLIRNACQFTERGAVRVTVTLQEVIVEDTGSGIPEDVKDRIFERFVRIAPVGVSGTGLGLAIVRRVTDHLGWTINLSSSQFGGSQFIVRFPAAR